MKMDVRMTLQPAVIFGLVSVQVIQDDVDLAAFVDGRDVVHEVEKLATPSAPIVSGDDESGSHFQRGEKRRRAVPPVAVREARQGLAVGQA